MTTTTIINQVIANLEASNAALVEMAEGINAQIELIKKLLETHQ